MGDDGCAAAGSGRRRSNASARTQNPGIGPNASASGADTGLT
jgi:hypothetical protein